MTDKPKVYVVPTQKWGEDIAGTLLSAEGEAIHSHVSSSMAWLVRDLTIGFDNRRTALEDRYPGGYEVVIIPEGEPAPEWLLAANKAFYADKNAEGESS